MDNSGNRSSDDEFSGEEDCLENEDIVCLFCSLIFQSFEQALDHCRVTHNFDLTSLKSKFQMDCYSYIKLINYIKTNNSYPDELMNTNIILWNDDKYLQPVGDDQWLMFDFDSLNTDSSSPNTYHANVENGLVTLSQAHFIELQTTIQSLTDQLKESQTHLQMAREDMQKMQQVMSKMVGVDSHEISNVNGVNTVSELPVEMDEGYFNSYAHFGIHFDMLSDKVRTESYRDAILSNKNVFQNKTVLDLGCGTGILSLFSASAGAIKVVALDQSDIVYNAMDIVKENNLENTIKVVKGKLETTDFEDKFDIIISEWMGYFLLFEGMLDSVVYARNKHLKSGGIIVPNKCNISLVACGDVDTHKKIITFWSDVYGYKMNCMKSEVVREANVDIVEAKHIISKPCIVHEIDLNICTTEVIDFESKFSLEITNDGLLTCLVGYFDTFFDLPHQISFSTSPHSKPTHWKQTVFIFEKPTQVKKGQIIEGDIVCRRQKNYVRGLTIEMRIFGKSHVYILS